MLIQKGNKQLEISEKLLADYKEKGYEVVNEMVLRTPPKRQSK